MENTIQLELTEEEIRFCMKGIHGIWDNYGISQDEIKLLIKLEKYVGMTETKDYLEAINFPLTE